MPRQSWEYQSLFERDGESPLGTFMEELNELGDEGWEVVGMVQPLVGQTKTADGGPPGLFAMGMGVLMKRSKDY